MEQLSCWTLFHLSPILKVITGLHSGPWNFLKLRLGPCLPPLSVSLCSLSPPTAPRRPPPRWVAPAKSDFASASRGAPASSWTHCPLALEPPPLATPPRRAQKLLAAATSPPPWLALCRTPELYLARAPEPVAPLHSILRALSPFSRPQTPEHHRLRHGRRLPLSSPSRHLLRLFPP